MNFQTRSEAKRASMADLQPALIADMGSGLGALLARKLGKERYLAEMLSITPAPALSLFSSHLPSLVFHLDWHSANES
jgi:hypothetical protein